MQRLEKENHNTKDYYNKVLLEHFDESGLDISDVWRIAELLKKFSGGKLLDIGCGISPVCLIAQKKYEDADIHGIDFADKLIDRLSSNPSNIHYEVGDFNKLEFQDEFFDYAILGEIIEHTDDPKKVIDEAFRVLKKGGVLALSTPNNETNESHKYEQHIWSFNEEDIKEMLGDYLVEVEVMGGNLIAYGEKS